MTWPAPITLTGKTARLEPLSPTHAPGLIEAVTDGNLWELWYTSIPSPKEMEANITRRLALQAKDEMLPFTIFNQATGQTIGMTTYMNINTECKLLLLAHAFETLNCIAVEFRTHFFNHQSRRAIERLGARQDGILRSHRVNAEGLLRDTVVYSIIAAEWPTIRQHLRFLTARPPASRIE
jgi:RimJ/RimL family protein N-acetyltransferase